MVSSSNNRVAAVKSRAWTHCCVAVIVLAAAPVGAANLWLPLKYKRQMPMLEKAVEQVAAGERCEKVVRGELLQSQSTTTEPVFRIICRDAQLQTYATLIDGVTLKELHASGETRLEQRQRHLPNYTRICLTQLKAQSTRMIEPQFPAPDKVQPSLINEEEVRFEVDFSAQSQAGTELLYRGYCDFTDLVDFRVKVRPRPKH